jgi:valyl-tRNA synthetase
VIELLKGRAYSGGNFLNQSSKDQEQAIGSLTDSALIAQTSARATLAISFSTFLRLLAPILPFTTEDLWSQGQYNNSDGQNSIHRSSWPKEGDYDVFLDSQYIDLLNSVISVLGQIRGAKTAAKRSLRWPVAQLTITTSEQQRSVLELAIDDIKLTGVIVGDIVWLTPKEQTQNLPLVEVLLQEEANKPSSTNGA